MKKKSAPKQKPKPARESFLPKTPGQPPPTVTVAKIIAPDGERDDTIELVVKRVDDRTIELTLTVAPLVPCVERIFLPLEATRFRLASIIAGAISRAAQSAEMDGIVQQARREEEDAEAKERIAERRSG